METATAQRVAKLQLEESKDAEQPVIDKDLELYDEQVPIPPFKEPKIYKNVAELIGWTPLVEINSITKAEQAHARIVVKLEGLNPGGSVKDRIALSMIEDAEKKGLITRGISTLVEPTSGNTGIALAMVGLRLGYKVAVIMPHTYSIERRIVLRALGAEIYVTDASKGLDKLLSVCKDLLTSTPNSHMLNQFDNPFNPVAHFKTTGPEIWAATEGQVDIFVGTCGTGGTITGVARYLKSRSQRVQIIALEPAESPVLQGGQPGPHVIQGTGPGMIPQNTHPTLFDEIISVTGDEALAAAKRLAKEEGLLVGISSGSAFAGALKVQNVEQSIKPLSLGSHLYVDYHRKKEKVAKRPENAGKLIVTIFPSSGERYLSTVLFASVKEEVEKLKLTE